MGPFIVPKEFVSNPQALGIKVILNGKIFQEGTSADMIHNIYEQVQYASNIHVAKTWRNRRHRHAARRRLRLNAAGVLQCRRFAVVHL